MNSRWEGLVEVSLMTTSRGPFEEDVFFLLAFDDAAFIRAMGFSGEGMWMLWRR